MVLEKLEAKVIEEVKTKGQARELGVDHCFQNLKSIKKTVNEEKCRTKIEEMELVNEEERQKEVKKVMNPK